MVYLLFLSIIFVVIFSQWKWDDPFNSTLFSIALDGSRWNMIISAATNGLVWQVDRRFARCYKVSVTDGFYARFNLIFPIDFQWLLLSITGNLCHK
jgi:hypothetical protein